MQISQRSLSERAADYCRRPEPYRFSLSSLMLLVTLASVLMGVVTVAPLLGILLMGMSVLAVARTNTAVRLGLNQNRIIGVGEKIGLFVTFLIGIAVVFVTALITFLSAGCIGMLTFAAISSVTQPGMGVDLLVLLVFVAACFLAAFVTFQVWKVTGPGLT